MVDTIPIVKNHIYIENLIKNEIPLFVVNEWEEIMNVIKIVRRHVKTNI